MVIYIYIMYYLGIEIMTWKYIIDVRYPLSEPCAGIIMKLFAAQNRSTIHVRPTTTATCDMFWQNFFLTLDAPRTAEIRLFECKYACIIMCVCARARSKNLISRPAVIAYTEHITYTLIIILRHCIL